MLSQGLVAQELHYITIEPNSQTPVRRSYDLERRRSKPLSQLIEPYITWKGNYNIAHFIYPGEGYSLDHQHY